MLNPQLSDYYQHVCCDLMRNFYINSYEFRCLESALFTDKFLLNTYKLLGNAELNMICFFFVFGGLFSVKERARICSSVFWVLAR